MSKVLKLFIIILIFLLIVQFSESTAFSSEKYLLTELIEPSSISIDDKYIYIPEQTSIYIYNLKDFTLKKKIGKQGEGPEEFMLSVVNGYEELILDVLTPSLLVNSMGKISIFSKEKFLFVREIKNRTRSRDFRTLGQGFAGQGMVVENGIQYRSVNVYNSELEKKKEVYRVKHHFQINEGLKVFYSTTKFITWDNKLFVAWEPDFVIRVYDKNGKELYLIELDYDRQVIGTQFKEKTIHYLKTSKKYRRLFEMLNIKVHFPKKFPAIENILIDHEKLYVTTFKIINKKTECYILNIKGKQLRKVFLPIKRSDETEEFLPYPYTIYNGKLYQLINRDEQWHLETTEF